MGGDDEPGSCSHARIVRAGRHGGVCDEIPERRRHSVARIGPRRGLWDDAALALANARYLVGGLLLLYFAQGPLRDVTAFDPFFLQHFVLNMVSFVGSWLVMAFFFGLLFEYLVGSSGIQKAVRLGLIILALTVPFQLIGAIAGQLTLGGIGLRTLQILAFLALLGASFDLS